MYTCSMWIPKYELTIPFPSHSSQFPFPSTFQICRSYNTERPAVPRRQRHAVVDSSDLIKGKASPYSITERRVPSWSRFLAVSLQVTWVINPAVGCHYFPRGPQLPSQPLRGLLPVFHAHGNLMGRHLRKPMHSRTSLLGEWCRYSARRRSANQLITAKSCGDRIIDAMMRFVRCLRRLNENRTRIVRPPPFIHYSRHSTRARRRRPITMNAQTDTHADPTKHYCSCCQNPEPTATEQAQPNYCSYHWQGWLGSRVVSVLDSGAEGPGFKSRPRRCQVTVLGKLLRPIVPLFTKQQNW